MNISPARTHLLTLTALFLASLASACGDDSDDTSSSEASTTMSTTAAETGSTDTGGTTTCDDSCPGVLSAACMNGPVDTADCQAGCSFSQMACPTEFAAVFGCFGASPTFSCDAAGRVTSAGCETEYAALYGCLGV